MIFQRGRWLNHQPVIVFFHVFSSKHPSTASKIQRPVWTQRKKWCGQAIPSWRRSYRCAASKNWGENRSAVLKLPRGVPKWLVVSKMAGFFPFHIYFIYGMSSLNYWLVVWKHGILFSISYEWIILPIDELHHFSRGWNSTSSEKIGSKISKA